MIINQPGFWTLLSRWIFHYKPSIGDPPFMETPIYLLHLLYYIMIYIISIISLTISYQHMLFIHHKCGIISILYYIYTIYILDLSISILYIILQIIYDIISPWSISIVYIAWRPGIRWSWKTNLGGMWRDVSPFLPPGLATRLPCLKPLNLAHMKSSRISLLQIKTDGFQVTFLQSNNHVCW